MIFRFMETLVIALIGGAVFAGLKIPLPWMLGPLAAVMCWSAWSKREVYWPVGVRNSGLVILGAMMGSHFTTDTVRQIAGQFPGMVLATGVTVAFSFLLAGITARQTGISLASSLLGSIPGGLSQMVVLCDEIQESDVTVVTFMQTIRLLSVVFIVPFLAMHGVAGNGVPGVLAQMAPALPAAPDGMSFRFIVMALGGACLAYFLKLPTPYLLGPLLGVGVMGAGGISIPGLPPVIGTGAQVCVGAFMGISTKLSSLNQHRKLLPYALLGGVGVVLFSLLLGYLLTWLYPLTLATAFLSTAPGGIAEMGLTAALVGADVSIVSAYQIFRLLFILFIVPYIVKWWLKAAVQAKPCCQPETNTKDGLEHETCDIGFKTD